ncbi:MAG: hypothetical protein ACI9SJ_001130 [Flavobacteriaceae bacterium]|jgi:uncharacterized protein (DUF2141 family)|uniref:DUF2141 domain-containing protein n=1 Tax=Candidatus Marifrigoribacter sp. Uisw_064 TaxID=3230970 RepID=UPI003ADEF73F
MQTVLLYLSLLFSGAMIQAQNTVEVSITNFGSNDGNVYISLHDSEANFLEKGMVSKKSEINKQKANFTFSELPDGTYAVSCFHDEDNNGKMNMIMGMIPLEDYGTSNNAPARFGPPKWNDAKFEVSNGEIVKLDIKL